MEIGSVVVVGIAPLNLLGVPASFKPTECLSTFEALESELSTFVDSGVSRSVCTKYVTWTSK